MTHGTGLDYLMSVYPGDSGHQANYQEDLESWDPVKCFFVDTGSIFDPNFGYAADSGIDEKILDQIAATCRGQWWWAWDEYTSFIEDPHGCTIFQGRPHTAQDVIRRLWIHFDSRDDAMLSRITLVDLRSARHAVGGRMPGGTL